MSKIIDKLDAEQKQANEWLTDGKHFIPMVELKDQFLFAFEEISLEISRYQRVRSEADSSPYYIREDKYEHLYKNISRRVQKIVLKLFENEKSRWNVGRVFFNDTDLYVEMSPQVKAQSL